MCGQRAAVHFLYFPRAGKGVRDRNISNGSKQRRSLSGVGEKHMGK